MPRPCTGATARENAMALVAHDVPGFFDFSMILVHVSQLKHSSNGSRSPSWSRAAHYAWACGRIFYFWTDRRSSGPRRARGATQASIGNTGFGATGTLVQQISLCKGSTRGDRSETIYKKYLCRPSAGNAAKTREPGLPAFPLTLSSRTLASAQRRRRARLPRRPHGCPTRQNNLKAA